MCLFGFRRKERHCEAPQIYVLRPFCQFRRRNARAAAEFGANYHRHILVAALAPALTKPEKLPSLKSGRRAVTPLLVKCPTKF